MFNRKPRIYNFGTTLNSDSYILFDIKSTDRENQYKVTATLKFFSLKKEFDMGIVKAKKEEDIWKKNKLYNNTVLPLFKKFYEENIESEKEKRDNELKEKLIQDYYKSVASFNPDYRHLEGAEYSAQKKLHDKIKTLKDYLGDKVD